MEVLRGVVVVQEARGKKQNDMQTNISRQNENSNERRKEEDEVLPFRGRGFLRVHGHERCLLAALWPRDHRRRRNGTESSFFPHTSCFFCSSLSPPVVCLSKGEGYCLPSFSSFTSFSSSSSSFLSVLCPLTLKRRKDGGRGSTEGDKRAATVQCTVCVCLPMSLCVCVRVDRESSNVSQAPLLMSEPPPSLPFLPSFSSFTLPLSLTFPPLTEAPFFLSPSFLCFLPLWCRWLNRVMKSIHRLSIHSVSVSVDAFHPFLSV